MSKKLKSLIFVTCGTDLLARRVKHIAPLSLKDKWLDPKVNKKNSQNIRYLCWVFHSLPGDRYAISSQFSYHHKHLRSLFDGTVTIRSHLSID